ncbi:uncharacterized protein LOC130691565 [Daphnia carinata]|uniref:uncharacterized protein LOC130691565 n=1 Tax=Daphnia carinata TaxID=120202 RepID=UPI00257F9E38|nr:uncharacterized protein LOC130691565 [Daphnia carinata]
MYGRLSVFLSLLVFACAAQINLRELENILDFVMDEIDAEGVFSNRDHLPTPPPMPQHRSNYKTSNRASRGLYSRLFRSKFGTLDDYGSVSEITLQVTAQHPSEVNVQEVAFEVPGAALYFVRDFPAPISASASFKIAVPSSVAYAAPAPVKVKYDFPAPISAPAPAPVKVEYDFPARISAPAPAPVAIAVPASIEVVKNTIVYDFPAPISEQFN